MLCQTTFLKCANKNFYLEICGQIIPYDLFQSLPLPDSFEECVQAMQGMVNLPSIPIMQAPNIESFPVSEFDSSSCSHCEKPTSPAMTQSLTAQVPSPTVVTRIEASSESSKIDTILMVVETILSEIHKWVKINESIDRKATRMSKGFRVGEERQKLEQAHSYRSTDPASEGRKHTRDERRAPAKETGTRRRKLQDGTYRNSAARAESLSPPEDGDEVDQAGEQACQKVRPVKPRKPKAIQRAAACKTICAKNDAGIPGEKPKKVTVAVNEIFTSLHCFIFLFF